jgi:hypothetical protein
MHLIDRAPAPPTAMMFFLPVHVFSLLLDFIWLAVTWTGTRI